MVERIGTFKIRMMVDGEHFLHAPKQCIGDYVLYLEDDGTLKYIPIKE